MEGAAGDPYRRPARRTQWLLSALAHHYGLDRGVENEIVVLATGLDQYLQEVFHHLDCRGAGRLPRADFRALCAVLGLRSEGPDARDAAAEDENSAKATATEDSVAGVAGRGDDGDDDADLDEEARVALRAEPLELTFRQFHARLCGYFGSHAGPRLPRGALSEHIETQIRLRRPRRRRRPPGAPRPDGDPDGQRLARLEEENDSLRELVEDLRAALQSSDARCLALQVGLWKSQGDAPEAAARELQRAQSVLADAEARAERLQRGQAEVRRRAEEARRALLRSLHRVRELEALARSVPRLQRAVHRREAELRRYRSEETQFPNPSQAHTQPGDKSVEAGSSGARDPHAAPEDAWQSDSSCGSRAPDEGLSPPASLEDEQLFRSVEGQAASEEEEEKEEMWQKEQRASETQAKERLGLPSGCRSKCADQMAKELRTSFSHCNGADNSCYLGKLEASATRRRNPSCDGKTVRMAEEEAELRQTVETEQLRLELQMVETERVRLSLLEEKLVDVLQLLRRLCHLNISKRALGKIVLSALDQDPTQEDTGGPSAILDTLHQALAGCELLQRHPTAQDSTAPALSNSLLISC
uniref:EF-hand and coiled-coil domain-containing protein 1 isoform X2 n=1 Tax=Jaculus jaculus TaxID=51337 RepID=UPI001E1B0D7C|nr:EF-hand and coiled-coil domain-containing protein 1 isoform X2 [Jaculus jaculus]